MASALEHYVNNVRSLSLSGRCKIEIKSIFFFSRTSIHISKINISMKKKKNKKCITIPHRLNEYAILFSLT